MVVWIDNEAYLTSEETCVLLGVKAQTLYAYVSRGLLHSFRQGIRRQRLYLRREVETLMRLMPARGGRRGRRTAAIPHAEDWVGDI